MKNPIPHSLFPSLLLVTLGACNTPQATVPHPSAPPSSPSQTADTPDTKIATDSQETFNKLFADYPWDMKQLAVVEDFKKAGVIVDFDAADLATPLVWAAQHDAKAANQKANVVRHVSEALKATFESLQAASSPAVDTLGVKTLRLTTMGNTRIEGETLLLTAPADLDQARLTAYFKTLGRLRTLAMQKTRGVLVTPAKLEALADLSDPSILESVQKFDKAVYPNVKAAIDARRAIVAEIELVKETAATAPFQYDYATKVLRFNSSTYAARYAGALSPYLRAYAELDRKLFGTTEFASDTIARTTGAATKYNYQSTVTGLRAVKHEQAKLAPQLANATVRFVFCEEKIGQTRDKAACAVQKAEGVVKVPVGVERVATRSRSVVPYDQTKVESFLKNFLQQK